MPDAAGKLFEFCSVNGEMDGWRQGRHFFRRLWRCRFSPVKFNSNLQTEISSEPSGFIKQSNVSFTKSFGYSTVLVFVLFPFGLQGFLFMYQTNSGSIHQTFKEHSFPLSCVLKIRFLKLVLFFFFQGPHPFLQVTYRSRWLSVAYGTWSLRSMEKWI